MDQDKLTPEYLRARDLARTIAESSDLDTTLAAFLDRAIEETQATRGYIAITANRYASTVRLHQHRGQPAGPWDGKEPISETLVRCCLDLGTVLSNAPFETLVTRSQKLALESESIKLDRELHSAIASPFVDPTGRPLGALVVFKNHATFAFGDRLVVDQHAAAASVALARSGTTDRAGSADRAGTAERAGKRRERPVEHIPGLVGEAYKGIGERLRLFAPKARTLLVTGEPGTGKEAMAKAFHRLTGREGPLLTLNSAGLSDALADSELFGHAAGAFTDAKTQRSGMFKDADGGTIFLDELGDMSVSVQAKLLRTLQDGKVRRVGDSEERTVDVRVVGATNRDLEAMIADGEFRQDLFDRFAFLILELPPLRDHLEDLRHLVPALLARAVFELDRKATPEVTPRAMKKLEAYDWPGNVRELHQALSRAVILTVEEGAPIEPEVIEFVRKRRIGPATDTSEESREWQLKRAQIFLDKHYRVSRIAQALGVDRGTLHRWLREGKLVKPRSPSRDPSAADEEDDETAVAG